MNTAVPAKSTLGSLLRNLRARLGLTLKQMSERTGVPMSTLSKVEHDRLTLTYDKLQMISERLNVHMSELFSEPEAPVRVAANGRRSLGTLSGALSVSTPNYDYFYMCPELRHKDMIPIVSRVKARTIEEFGPLLRHQGEEYIYVLEGVVEVHTEFYDPVKMNTGESVYIDSKMGHAYVVGDDAESATILSVCSSSQEELIGSLPVPPSKEAQEPSRQRPVRGRSARHAG
ncbi:MAG: XRE family transcriptional regulator [Caulobacteraceae bacterium]|nr:XRE family transcriptional regulator [Caulobacteraceae bacterium]